MNLRLAATLISALALQPNQHCSLMLAQAPLITTAGNPVHLQRACCPKGSLCFAPCSSKSAGLTHSSYSSEALLKGCEALLKGS